MITGLKQAIGATAAMVVLILVIIVGCGLLALAGYEVNAWLSAPVGAAGVKSKTNDSENRVEAQYQYGADKNAIQADVSNIQQNTTMYYQQGQTNYLLSLVQSAQNTCREDVAAYNTLAEGTTTAPWRPAQDPASYDAASTCAMPPK